MKTTLRRYTELPYLIDFLTSGEIAMLNPSSWDDRNDSFYIERYSIATGFSGTYALCLAEAPETYHHWKVFSGGSGGVCIEFDKESLVAAVEKVDGLRAESVEYRTISQLRNRILDIEELPFLKRYAYLDEKEFRLFHAIPSSGSPVFRVKIPMKAVSRITLSPWLPKAVVTNVKQVLKSVKGCKSLNIYRSTLIDNSDWKKQAHNVANLANETNPK